MDAGGRGKGGGAFSFELVQQGARKQTASNRIFRVFTIPLAMQAEHENNLWEPCVFTISTIHRTVHTKKTKQQCTKRSDLNLGQC